MSISNKTQEFFASVIEIAVIPIMILNLVGGIGSGIWLAFLGEWRVIFSGILFMAIASFGIGLALMPALLFFAAPADQAMKNGKKFLGLSFAFLNVLYSTAVMTIFCMLVMRYYVNSSNSNGSVLPFLIWSYGVALAPWLATNRGEQKSTFETLLIFTAQIAYIVGMILVFVDVDFEVVWIVFGSMMFCCAVVGFVIQSSGDFKTIFVQKNVKEAIGVLKLASEKFGRPDTILFDEISIAQTFSLVKERVEKVIYSNEKYVGSLKGKVLREYVFANIANVSGNMVESGHYHIYRGILNERGNNLLKIFDTAIDELVESGDITRQRADEQKAAVRKNIKESG